MRNRVLTGLSSLCVLISGASHTATAQARTDSTPVTHKARAPISIGNYPNVAGLRLNFRDRNLELVRGANITIWSPYKRASGTVRGLALGLPTTGAGALHGIALAPIGLSSAHDIQGIALAGIGLGAGGLIKGIAIGGIGLGTGGAIEGIAIGGLGVGAQGDLRGLMIGGIGTAAGGSIHGIVLSGIGTGAARDFTGLALSGIGTGVAGHFKGIALSGVASGAGGNFTGLSLSGVGAAAGAFHGIAIAGLGIGAVEIHGFAAAAAVGAMSVNGIVVAPVLMRVRPDGEFRGASISAFNYIRGEQHGLNIGLINYARSVHGLQVGIINIIGNAKSHKVLPIVNWESK